ncbi:Homeodomain-interacting protein kinase 1 [Dissostichus eleginoides]|uniref:Homeodomain-interacting protein kinase 1 n=1 Tax=Dissostichus eleginoides TaxID=100907 RepID=A0AAD9ETH6_DISEL|nr:Homeodomain-interacting protein kinase 1 [Dissostichus eleginoides]
MAASFDSDLQVIRGAKLSSKFSDYLVLDLIGQGAFAKVTKCVKSATNETVAVRITKIQTEKEHGILQKLRSFDSDVGNFVRWDTSFLYKDHLCQEFELLDMNLKEFVDTRKTLSLHLKDIRPIVHQVATALKVLKGLGITHTDVRPENIMLVDHVRQPLKVKLIDFGSACDATKAEQVPSMQHTWYMAPEAMLGLLCDEPIDMWSLGCIAVELFLGSPLYPGSCEYDMICKITQTQGEMPGHLLNAGLKTRKFYLNTCPNKWTLMTPHEYGGMSVIDGRFSSLDDLKKVQPKQVSHASKAHAMRDKADLENFVELVKQMLQLDPIQRITPSQVLQHLFVKTSHQMDFCPPQSLRSTHQPSSKNRYSPGAKSPQKPLKLDENTSSITLIRPERKRKRVYARNRCRECASPVRKKRRTCEGRPSVKRRYWEIPEGTRGFGDFTSPERKKRRIWEDKPMPKRRYSKARKRNPKTSSSGKNMRRICGDAQLLVNKPIGSISNGSPITPKIPSREKMVGKVTPQVKRPSGQISGGSTTVSNISSPEKMIWEATPLAKSTSGQKSWGSTTIPKIPSPEKMIWEATPLAKRHSGQKSWGSTTIPKIPSPEKMIWEATPLAKRHSGQKSWGSTTIPKIPSPEKMIWEATPLAKSTSGQMSWGSTTIPKIPSPEKMIWEATPLAKRPSVELPSGSKHSPQISPPEIMGLKSIVITQEKDTTMLPSTSKDAASTVTQQKSLNQGVDKNGKTLIWIIGSGYVQRGEVAAYENFGENFGLDVKVQWFGTGGMLWKGVLPRFQAELSNSQRPPDILVIHAGGNNLGTMPAMNLASVMNNELMKLHSQFPSMAIAYSCITERQVWRNGPPGKVNYDRRCVNQLMQKNVGNLGGEVIQHPLLRFFDNNIYLPDGVNFSKKGNGIFVSSIRSVVMKILQKSHT